MINLYIVLAIIVIHWIADFVCQTDEMAIGKSKNWKDLTHHTVTYSFIFFMTSLLYLAITGHFMIMFFAPITFICHTATDFYTSRVNSQYHAEGKIHEFFVSIGFDQVLHYFQLILTYYLLVC